MVKASSTDKTVVAPAKHPDVIRAQQAVQAAEHRLADLLATHQQLCHIQEGDDRIANAQASLAIPGVITQIQHARVTLETEQRAYEVVYEKAKIPWNDHWQEKLQSGVLRLIDTLHGEVYEANEQLRLIEEEAAAAGCRFTPLHMHRLDKENLNFWTKMVRREVGL